MVLPHFLFYLVIFCAKLVEVSLATLRTVLINRGQKLLGASIGFIEVTIWLILVSTVLKDVTKDFTKVFFYCSAFSCGNYLGATIEEKLAIGMSVIEVLTTEEFSDTLATALRDSGFGVTTISSNGKDQKMSLIKVFLKRRRIKEACSVIKNINPNCLLSISDVKNVTGGFIKK